MSVEMDPDEKTSLPVHVVACGARYKALGDKLEETRKRTWRIERYALAVLLAVIAELAGLVIILWDKGS